MVRIIQDIKHPGLFGATLRLREGFNALTGSPVIRTAAAGMGLQDRCLDMAGVSGLAISQLSGFETLAALMLVLGYRTRLALMIVLVAGGAVWLGHLLDAWLAAQPQGGWERPLLWAAIPVLLVQATRPKSRFRP